MYPRLSFAATVSGVIFQLAGLAVDAALHAQDPDLAAHEGLFTLSNPGHLLFLAGLVLTALGVGTTLLALLLRGTDSVVASPGAGRRMIAASASALITIVALTLVVGVFAPADAAFTGQARSSHAQDDAGGSSPQHPAINISWEQLHETDRMLAEAKAATEKYRDVDRARADGYRQVMGALRGTGAHFVNQQYLDDEGGFDVAHPEALLYDRADDGSLELVGVAYMLPRWSDNEVPPTYFGPLAEWHDHDFHRPCLTTRTWGHPVTINRTEADCRAAGYVFIPPKFWMLHVWLFRPSPEGVFSHDNNTIEGPPDVSVVGEIE